MVEETKKPVAKKTATSKAADSTKTVVKKAAVTKAVKPAAEAGKWPFPDAEKAPAVKKPAVKKASAAPAPKKAAKAQAIAQPSAQERYRMVETAAYYIAERSGFQGCTTDHWAAAEIEIAAKLAG